MEKVICIIPARLASTRFKGKPLAKILGHTMIEHVFRRVLCARQVDDVCIATCDHEIAEEVKKFGGKAVMTSESHTRGTDRVAEAAHTIEGDIIINVQGDEPLIDPESLDEAISIIKGNKELQCMNVLTPIFDWDVFISRNIVKAVIDQNNDILYFSRQPIPTSSKEKFTKAIKQIGIYLFKKDFLLKFTSWDETPLEQAEGVDMMRILEYGYPIKGLLSKDMIGVDTPEQLAAIEKILKDDPLCKKIFGIKN